jgi:hypothetical protein
MHEKPAAAIQDKNIPPQVQVLLTRVVAQAHSQTVWIGDQKLSKNRPTKSGDVLRVFSAM